MLRHFFSGLENKGLDRPSFPNNISWLCLSAPGMLERPTGEYRHGICNPQAKQQPHIQQKSLLAYMNVQAFFWCNTMPQMPFAWIFSKQIPY